MTYNDLLKCDETLPMVDCRFRAHFSWYGWNLLTIGGSEKSRLCVVAWKEPVFSERALHGRFFQEHSYHRDWEWREAEVDNMDERLRWRREVEVHRRWSWSLKQGEDPLLEEMEHSGQQLSTWVSTWESDHITWSQWRESRCGVKWWNITNGRKSGCTIDNESGRAAAEGSRGTIDVRSGGTSSILTGTGTCIIWWWQ